MPKYIYDAKTKAAIVSAISKARLTGKRGRDVYEAAQAAGYKGSPPALRKLIYSDKAFASIPRVKRNRGLNRLNICLAAAEDSLVYGIPRRDKPTDIHNVPVSDRD